MLQRNIIFTLLCWRQKKLHKCNPHAPYERKLIISMAFNFPFNFLRPSSPSLLPSVTAQSRHRFYMASHKFQSQSTEAKAKSSKEKITFEIIVNMNKKRERRSLSYETVKLDENETRKSRTTTRTTTTAMSIQLKARLGCCLFSRAET